MEGESNHPLNIVCRIYPLIASSSQVFFGASHKRRLVNRGELAAYRVGSEYRFKLSDLEDYLQRQRISAGEGQRYSEDPIDEFIQKAGKKFMLIEIRWKELDTENPRNDFRNDFKTGT